MARALRRPTHADDEKLRTYRAKRDFARTPEPTPKLGSSPAGDSFVVQKHAARRLHYDFRLELDGVLLSWAIPNGPSLDPADRRLAVRTEDHPLAYGGFEGVIPEGAYGGGTVMLWDRGRWEPIGDARKGLAKGRLKFRLEGDRLTGGWTLARMKPKPNERGDKENWLLIKSRDDAARPGAGTAWLEEHRSSVASGRSMDAIAAGQGGATVPARRPPRYGDAVAHAPKGRLPDFVPPQLATLVDQPPSGDRWLHEIKYDGYRTVVRVQNGKARMLTRKGLDWTKKFQPIADLAAALPARSALIDGEVVVLDASGVTSFNSLQETLSVGQVDRLVYYAFDLLHLDGKNLARLPLEQRKAALATLLAQLAPDGRIRYSEHYVDRGPEFYRHACRLALEGVVSKRRDCIYRGGRGGDWVKTKCTRRQEFVIGGWLPSTAAGRALRSLLVGYFRNGEFVYAGKVGSGFTGRSGRDLLARMKPIARKSLPFADLPAEARRGARWVEPRLVAEIEFAAWTDDGLLRHSTFKGLREDKDPAEVTLETPPGTTGQQPAAKGSTRTTYAGVTLSNPNRMLWPDDGITKQALAEYCSSVALLMLPHVANRPLSLVRCPDGLGGKCFFQRHMVQGLPAAIRPVKVRQEKEHYLAIDDVAGLLSLVQFAALEIHPWGSRVDDPDKPDRLIMDFDPDEAVPWKRVIAAALECRERLDRLGFVSFVKTTGGKGLHVVVPLDRRHSWAEVKGFAEALASAMAADDRLYTTTMAKRARKGRIFIDYLRNDRTATAVAPYSTRARAGAPVAAPVDWDELASLPSGRHYTLLNMPRRLASAQDDPWAGMASLRQRITAKARKAVNL